MSDETSDDQADALVQLLAPDGYYKYLGVTKPASNAGNDPDPASGDSSGNGTSNGIDEEAVKKAYRRLSRKHHPDKGGEADTFRVLNRAQRVLLNNKLRQQYDILGIDLDDDEEHASGDKDENDGDGIYNQEKQSTAEGIVHEIASMTLTSIIQLAVKTGMMAAVSVILVVYRISLFPALIFLAYISFQMFQRARLPGGSIYDPLPPLMIATGLIVMYKGRTEEGDWTKLFWLGEALVLGMFTFNSFNSIPKTNFVIFAIACFAILASLWFRGKVWNYAIVIGLEAFLAIFVAMAFPIMELILEAVLNEKLRKVGDKVRAHHRHLEAYYAAKLQKRR